MAKKTTKAPETTTAPVAAPIPVTTAPASIPGGVAKGTQEARDKMAAIRAARGTGDAEGDTFTLIPYVPPAVAAGQPVPPDPRKKLAPQAMTIVNNIAAAPNGTITRGVLCKTMVGLTTRQPVGRIVTYYQKELQTEGYITLTKSVAAPAPVAPAAPAVAK